MLNPSSIILDWGTSSLRAMLVSEAGETLDSRGTSKVGIQFCQSAS